MVPRAAFTLLDGQDQLKVYQSSKPVERAFCAECGSPISYTHKENVDSIWITVGSLDCEPPCQPEYHIFISEKVPWLQIIDGLPQYPEFPPNH